MRDRGAGRARERRLGRSRSGCRALAACWPGCGGRARSRAGAVQYPAAVPPRAAALTLAAGRRGVPARPGSALLAHCRSCLTRGPRGHPVLGLAGCSRTTGGIAAAPRADCARWRLGSWASLVAEGWPCRRPRVWLAIWAAPGCAWWHRCRTGSGGRGDLRLVDSELSPVVDIRQRVPAARLRVLVGWPGRLGRLWWLRRARAGGGGTLLARLGVPAVRDCWPGPSVALAVARRTVVDRPDRAVGCPRTRGAPGSGVVGRAQRQQVQARAGRRVGWAFAASDAARRGSRRSCQSRRPARSAAQARQLSRSARPQPQGQSRS